MKEQSVPVKLFNGNLQFPKHVTLNGSQQSQTNLCKPIPALKSQLKHLKPPNYNGAEAHAQLLQKHYTKPPRITHLLCFDTAALSAAQDIFLHLFLDRIRLKVIISQTCLGQVVIKEIRRVFPIYTTLCTVLRVGQLIILTEDTV